MFIIASDASAIVSYTDRVVYLDDGEMAVLTPDTYQVKTLAQKNKNKEEHQLEWSDEEAQKAAIIDLTPEKKANNNKLAQSVKTGFTSLKNSRWKQAQEKFLKALNEDGNSP